MHIMETLATRADTGLHIDVPTGVSMLESRPTILIVEDDAAVRHSLRMVLEVFGYKVEDYHDGDSLLARASMADSCIVMDVNLPGRSGLEVVAELRARSLTVPVVLVSAQVTALLREKGDQLGVLAVLDKPLDTDMLFRTIDSVGAMRA